MISLKSLIPEIKIQPNTRLKVGDKYHFGYSGEFAVDIIITYINYKLNLVRFQIIYSNGEIADESDSLPIEDLMNDLKRAKKINEIKIVPNTREPREGDKWYWKRSPKSINTIVSITDEGHQFSFIYEDLDGTPIGPVSLQSLKEYINSGQVKLLKNISEIKIVPNQYQLQIGDILLFDYNNFVNHGDKLVRENNEHMEGYIIENDSGERYWISKKTILNCIKNKTIKINNG